MGIKGRKERALMRRGFYAQEALLRRESINELAFKRRSLGVLNENQLEIPFEKESVEDLVGIYSRCNRDREEGKEKESIYCRLKEVLENLDVTQKYETLESINTIYKFFKPKKVDNRSVFLATMNAILKNENVDNAIRLISEFLTNSEFVDSKIKKALLDLRKLGSEIGVEGLQQTTYGGLPLEDFLKNVRYTEYVKYEKSFAGPNLSVMGGRSKIDVKDFYGTVLNLYEKYKNKTETPEYIEELNFVAKTIFEQILNTDVKDLLYKADLKVENNLVYNGQVIIPSGSHLEVKKMDYAVDSYYSEYLAIYKKSDIQEIAFEPDFKKTYNILIDKIYQLLEKNGDFIIKKIQSDITGIIFDKNLIVLRDDIEFYWSNKGQRNCDEHRLSVRFRIKNSEINAYIYDSRTHNTELQMVEITLNPKNKQICPLLF